MAANAARKLSIKLLKKLATNALKAVFGKLLIGAGEGAVAEEVRLKVAETGPVEALVEVDFANHHRAKLLRTSHGVALVIPDGAKHPVA